MREGVTFLSWKITGLQVNRTMIPGSDVPVAGGLSRKSGIGT